MSLQKKTIAFLIWVFHWDISHTMSERESTRCGTREHIPLVTSYLGSISETDSFHFWDGEVDVFCFFSSEHSRIEIQHKPAQLDEGSAV